MEKDPRAGVLAAAIGHGNEVAGLNNDGEKAAGEELNEDGGEASGEEASITHPKPKRIYNTVGFSKRKICLSRQKKGKQKKQHMPSQLAGLLLVLIIPMPRKFLLTLWVTTNSETATGVLQRKM